MTERINRGAFTRSNLVVILLVLGTLSFVLAATYRVSVAPMTVSAISQGAVPGTPDMGLAAFAVGDRPPFYRLEGGEGGARGINVAILDPETGALLDDVRNFDTWGTRTTGVGMVRLIAYLERLDPGVLILMAVADDAGVNGFDTCARLEAPWVDAGLNAVEQITGSTLLRTYCYRDSWALVGFAGAERPLAEQLASDGSTVAVSQAMSLRMLAHLRLEPE